MLLVSHGFSDGGCVRSHNEDRILFNDALGLYVVCDGIGGRRNGEVAAELATRTIYEYIRASRDPMDVTWPYGFNLQLSLAGNRLLTAARLANRQVWRRSEESLQFLGMGTTVSAVLVDGTNAAVINVGDSRIYLCRGGKLEQLSTDDTIGGTATPNPEYAAEQAKYPQLKSVLTRAAGSQETVEVHLRQLELKDGDRLLLCSDGLHACVSDEAICATLSESLNPAAVIGSLSEAAKQAGAPDNVSAVLLDARSGDTA